MSVRVWNFPIFFNCNLEKAITVWKEKLKEGKIYDHIRLGSGHKGIGVDCLTFADDVAIFSSQPAVKEVARKVGL